MKKSILFASTLALAVALPVIFSSNKALSAMPMQALAAATKLPLSAGTVLKKGTRLTSPSGNHVLVVGTDGNLCVYTKSGGYVWGLDKDLPNLSTYGLDRVEFRQDGTLGAYDDMGVVAWIARNTRFDPKARLNITDEGVLQLTTPDEILWASNDVVGPITKKSASPVTATPTVSATTNSGSLIGFDSRKSSSSEIYVMNPDGTNKQVICTNDGGNEYPAWSPDGKKIAFQSGRGSGKWDIYVMDADGTNQIKLTELSGWNVVPIWSPDGKKLAFSNTGLGKNSDIYVMNADGTNLKQLTKNTDDDMEPTWSPDGTKIAFRSSRGTSRDIYVMNADGTNPTRLTKTSGDDMTPVWSPDGKKLAFSSGGSNGFDICVINADGTNLKQLTKKGGNSPAWSPDGNKIAFNVEGVGGYSNIYVMNADGTNLTRLTKNDGLNYGANYGTAWSTDGKKLAFLSNRDAKKAGDDLKNFDIYVMNADGTEQTRLTNTETIEQHLVWLPTRE